MMGNKTEILYHGPSVQPLLRSSLHSMDVPFTEDFSVWLTVFLPRTIPLTLLGSFTIHIWFIELSTLSSLWFSHLKDRFLNPTSATPGFILKFVITNTCVACRIISSTLFSITLYLYFSFILLFSKTSAPHVKAIPHFKVHQSLSPYLITLHGLSLLSHRN